jgi:hypothetical protein
MRSKGYLIGPAAEHIGRYPPIGGQPPTDPPAHQPGPWPWANAVSGLAEAAAPGQTHAGGDRRPGCNSYGRFL